MTFNIEIIELDILHFTLFSYQILPWFDFYIFNSDVNYIEYNVDSSRKLRQIQIWKINQFFIQPKFLD